MEDAMKKNPKLWVMIILILSAGLLVILAPQQPARAAVTWYVAPDGDDLNDCLRPDTACATVHAAIGKTAYGDSVILMPGTYNKASGETFPINIPPGIHLLGSGRDSTIIAGQRETAVINVSSSQGDILGDTVIQDMTLQNGSYGLLIYASETHTTSPQVIRLRLRWNEFGIWMNSVETYGDGARIGAVISDTQVLSNSLDGIALTAYGNSGPTFVAPYIINSTVQDNTNYGIAMANNSYSIYPTTMAPSIINTHIMDNGNHGVIAFGDDQGRSMPMIEQSWIEGNSGYGFYWFGYGNIQATITNTVIASNQAGGVYIADCCSNVEPSTFHIINSNIQNNLFYGINWYNLNPSNEVTPIIVNSILWNPSADDLYTSNLPWTTNEIHFSDVEDGDLKGQGGNFSADPNFLDDYHLSSCSPAIDAGTTTDMPSVDIDGDMRPQGNGPDVGVDEQELPRILSTNKQVSTAQARFGDTLAYTITITPTMVIPAPYLTLTDTLPIAVSLDPDSLWASEGEIAHTGNVVTWTGNSTPDLPINVGFLADVIAGKTIAYNTAFVEAGLPCLFRSPTTATLIEPLRGFLPTIIKKLPRLYGTVTENGAPASGIILYLRFFDGTHWFTMTSDTTDSDGSYSFTNIPGLFPGQYYYVQFPEQGWNPNWLWTWHTRVIGANTPGGEIHIGDFDIANVGLVSPANNSVVSLPTSFQWTPRGATPSDSYEFDLYDPYDGVPYFYTQPTLGYVGSYTLTNRPPGFNIGVWYSWEIWIYSPDGGYGISFESRAVSFTSGSLSALPAEQITPAKNAPDMKDRSWR